MVRTKIGTLLVAAAFVMSVASARADEPQKNADGKVEFSGGTLAIGQGLSWGTGTLTYQGKQYPFKVEGLSYGPQVGGTSTTGSGLVYHLTKVEDFEGSYTAVGAEATVAGGISATTMRNQHGVVIDSIGTTKGLKISIATQGVKITLK